MKLPPRKHAVVSRSVPQNFYPMKSATVQKPRAGKQDKSLTQVTPPSSDERHKLLLYVYDGMR